MITEGMIRKTTYFIYSQTEKYFTPSIFHIDLANEKGQELADKLNANKKIVLMGTLLMDCMLGVAIKEGRVKDHIKMSEEKAKEFLSQFLSLDEPEKENILFCIKQHHGAKEFYSIEAEICCNADCYRFLSIKGVIGGIRNFRKMELKETVDLFSKKADEKWNVLSLDICKKELEPQHKIVKEFLGKFKA